MTEQDASTAPPIAGFFGRDLIYLLLWAAQVGVSTLLTPVMTRLLGPAHFGVVAACLTLMQLLVAVAGFSLPIAIQRAFALHGAPESRRLVTLAILIALAGFAIVQASGPLWSPALGFGRYRGAAEYAVIWAPCTAVTYAALAIIRSRDRLGQFALINLLQTVLAEALSIALVLFVRRTASEYLLGELLAQAATMIVAIVLVRPLPLTRAHLRRAGAALTYAAPLVPAAVAAFVLGTSDRLVLQHYLGHAPVARYAVASNVGGIPIIVLEMLATTWMPRIFAARSDDALARSLALSRDALLVLLVPTVAGLSLCSPLLLRAWAPASFRPNGLLLIVALTATAAFPFAEASSHQRILMRCGKNRAVAIAAAAAAVCNLVLNVVLIPVIGITGPGVATLASYVFMDLLLGRASRRQLAVSPSSRHLLADVALCFAVSYGVVLLPVSTPSLIARGLLAAGCAVVAIATLTRLSRPRRLTAGPISTWLGSRLGAVEL